MSAALATLEQELSGAGFSIVPASGELRPGEPAAVQPAPRAAYRVLLSDPNSGWILIYDLGSPDAAEQAGRSFAAYLRSGVGQTNYPRDAQFTLSQAGAALIFSWWSCERAADAEAAAAAFEAISRVGTPIEVVR